MAWLEYYKRENERHPALHSAGITFEDATEVIGRLAKEYEIEVRGIDRTSGRRSSCWDGGSRRVVLNCDGLNWLLVLHEFAHAVEGKLRTGFKRCHNAAHADIVDALARAVVERGWLTSVAAERATRDLARQEKREARAAHAADPVVVRGKRIEDRRKQIVRLESRIKRAQATIKAITTRLKRARRSLAALERHTQKEGNENDNEG